MLRNSYTLGFFKKKSHYTLSTEKDEKDVKTEPSLFSIFDENQTI